MVSSGLRGHRMRLPLICSPSLRYRFFSPLEVEVLSFQYFGHYMITQHGVCSIAMSSPTSGCLPSVLASHVYKYFEANECQYNYMVLGIAAEWMHANHRLRNIRCNRPSALLSHRKSCRVVFRRSRDRTGGRSV